MRRSTAPAWRLSSGLTHRSSLAKGALIRWRHNYLGSPQARAGGRPPRIEDAVAEAVRQALADETGSVLAFLPGAGEIRRAAEALDGTLGDVTLAPLYGNLSAREQDAAIAPAPPGARKVVSRHEHRRDQPDD